MAVTITWLGHASFRIRGTRTVYVDPWQIADQPHDGDLVVISHIHHDHFSPEDLPKVLRSGGEVLAPPDVIAQLGKGHAAGIGEKVTLAGVGVETVWAYNPHAPFHPRENIWLGAVLTVDGKRIYYAGDTGLIDEMGELRNIDVALLPVGGKYTMDALEAAEACRRIMPALAIPCHYGKVIGGRNDAEAFAKAAPCKVKILQPGESVEL